MIPQVRKVGNPTPQQPVGSPTAGVGLAATGWAVLFAWLSVLRHLSLGSHAEDLGFTDQVISNFLRGQWFRMSIYAGNWNTEIDISQVKRPDSLLAFHVEPMLLLFVPLYALGSGVTVLLVIQAVGFALGAVPAYKLGGPILAAVYLLSPLGQWAVLSDFHTSTLAAPLLLLAVERSVHAAPRQAALAALLALSAREDVGPVVACLGVLVMLGFRQRRLGAGFLALGLAWTAVCLVIIRAYSGGVSPFAERYAAVLDNGPRAVVDAFTRAVDLGYLGSVLLSGGWLGLLAPLGLLPALPSLGLNLLSGSAWMAGGRAHYSALVLPFLVVAAWLALGKLARQRFATWARAGLLASSLLGYVLAGAGPLAAEYAPASLTDHARLADRLASQIPELETVSASSPLVPHLSHRPRVYVFPAVLDADDVFVDLTASPAPTSAGDVFLHLRNLLGGGGLQLGDVAALRAVGLTGFHIGTAARFSGDWNGPVDAELVGTWREALDGLGELGE